MIKIKNNKKGFSLIEILAVITLIGILSVVGIMGVSSLIGKSKNAKEEQLKKTLEMAGRNYFTANKTLPTNIGDNSVVYAYTLKNSKFLQENLKDDKNESCMTNSFVKVHKDSKNEYTYEAHLYCGTEVAEESSYASPKIVVYFTDNEGNKIESGRANPNVNQSQLHIEINGGNGKDRNGQNLTIDGYSFSISTKKNSSEEFINVYNSGSLSGNKQEKVIVNKNISEYIDITGSNFVLASVTATNSEGKKLTADSEGNINYYDEIPPICNGAFIGQVTGTGEINDWINAEDYSQGKTRKVTATCEDRGGSGCLREQFTKSWPNSTQKDGVYGYIQVKDNAGKVNNNNPNYIKNDKLCDNGVNDNEIGDSCRVRINIDTTYPKVDEVNVYKRASNGGKANNNNLIKSKKSGGGDHTRPNDYKLIDYTSYIDSQTNNGNGTVNNWFNDTYNYGIVYKIQISDNMQVVSWKWETNAANLKNNSSNYSVYGNGSEKVSGSFTKQNLQKCNNNNEKKEITVYFNDTGMRKGRLTVEDIAGNKSTFIIEANIDKEKPNCGGATDGSTTWNNYAKRTVGEKCTDAMSGCAQAKFTIDVTNEAKTLTVPITIRDNAGNTTSCSKTRNIYLDRTQPICNEGTRGNTTWKNASSVTVGEKCKDTLSGCTQDEFTKIETAEGKTRNVDITIKDIAGNTKSCSRSRNIYLDRTKPICNGGTRGNTTWKSVSSIKVGENCRDTLSGCTQSEFTKTETSEGKTRNVAITIQDNAGNTQSCSRSRNIYIDRTGPRCNGYFGESTIWQRSNRTIGVNCTDAYSGCATSSKSTTFTNSAKTSSVSFTLYDKVGNSTKCSKTANVYIDKTYPTISFAKKDPGCPSDVRVNYRIGTIKDTYSGYGKASSYYTISGVRFKGAGANGNTTAYEGFCAKTASFPVTYHVCDIAGNCINGSTSFSN